MLRRTIDSLILLAAIWLIVSPYVFGYYPFVAASGISTFLGLFILILATAELTLPDYWEEIAIVFLGLVATASPWLFRDIDYISHKATESMAITGAVLCTLAILGILVSTLQERGHSKLQHN